MSTHMIVAGHSDVQSTDSYNVMCLMVHGSVWDTRMKMASHVPAAAASSMNRPYEGSI